MFRDWIEKNRRKWLVYATYALACERQPNLGGASSGYHYPLMAFLDII